LVLYLQQVFVVNTFVIQADVYEAFDGIEYSIIGDAGNYNGNDCADATEWLPLTGTIDLDGLYPGEGRMLCARLNNLGEADLTYTLSNEIVTGLDNYADCVYAFGENSVSGTVLGLGAATDGYQIVVPEDAPVVNDCEIAISVIRG